MCPRMSFDYDLYRKNKNNRRERMLSAREKGTHTKDEWLEMKQFFNICVRCEGESNLKNQERDHVIPIYKGGSDSVKNLQPLCARCNSKKGPETIDWRLVFCEKHGLTMPLEWHQ